MIYQHLTITYKYNTIVANDLMSRLASKGIQRRSEDTNQNHNIWNIFQNILQMTSIPLTLLICDVEPLTNTGTRQRVLLLYDIQCQLH